MESISGRSPAKINLTLRVGPKRDDGYHDIESLVAQIGLFDEISISRRDDEQFTLQCTDPSIPSDDTNLVLRATKKLALAARQAVCGVHITLTKNIPAGAGMGGGSSNAATVLGLLRDLWKLKLSAVELAAIGAEIGSDVPLFLFGPLSVIRGRGERVEPIRASLVSAVVVVIPPIHSATNIVYEAFDALTPPAAREDLSATLSRVMQPNLSFPGGPAQIRGPELVPHLFNDLQTAACATNPPLADFASRLAGATGLDFCMTGSGSAFFHLFDKYTDRRYFSELRAAILAGVGAARVEQVWTQT